MSDTTLLLVVALPFVGVWLAAIIEVSRRGDLGPGRTFGWIAALLLVAPLALAVYVVARPPRSPRRSGGGDEEAPETEQFVLLAERRQRGELGDDEFQGAAAELIATARRRQAS